MSKHLGQTVSAPPDYRRLGKWMLVSILIHVVFFVVTSVGYIARGFKPEGHDKAKPAAAAPPAASAAPAAPAPDAAPAAAGDKPSSALPAVPKPKDADAEYFKDEKAPSAEELKNGPSLEIE
ncbi:MAG: hypothetical protein H0W72_12555 [Planctomycetes bacterium]|nr:hypothetical protein [Planctomycetota bacterium]